MAHVIRGEVEVESGLGLPRLTTAQRTAYTPPAKGYKVFDVDLDREFGWSGAAWVPAALDSEVQGKVDKAGDTMSGDLDMGGNELTGLPATPTATSATSVEYVDAQIANVAAGAASALDDLTDVDTTTTATATGQSLFFDGTNFVNRLPVLADISDFDATAYATGAEGDLAATALQDITGESIGDLSDVDITTTAPTDGQTLVWSTANGEFAPGTISADDRVLKAGDTMTGDLTLNDAGLFFVDFDSIAAGSVLQQGPVGDGPFAMTTDLANVAINMYEDVDNDPVEAGTMSIYTYDATGAETQLDFKSKTLEVVINTNTVVTHTDLRTTFAVPVDLPVAAPTVDEQAANKKYVDDQVTAATGAIDLDDLTDVTITGLPANGEALLATEAGFVNRAIVKADISDFTEADYVTVANAQTITGTKTFEDANVVVKAGTNTTGKVSFTNDTDVELAHIELDRTERGGLGELRVVTEGRIEQTAGDLAGEYSILTLNNNFAQMALRENNGDNGVSFVLNNDAGFGPTGFTIKVGTGASNTVVEYNDEATIKTVNFGRKLTAPSTVGGDGGTVLATKDYVDAAAGAGVSVLDDLTDVDTSTTAPVSRDALLFDGTNFVNRAIVVADVSDLDTSNFVTLDSAQTITALKTFDDTGITFDQGAATETKISFANAGTEGAYIEFDSTAGDGGEGELTIEGNGELTLRGGQDSDVGFGGNPSLELKKNKARLSIGNSGGELDLSNTAVALRMNSATAPYLRMTDNSLNLFGNGDQRITMSTTNTSVYGPGGFTAAPNLVIDSNKGELEFFTSASDYSRMTVEDGLAEIDVQDATNRTYITVQPGVYRLFTRNASGSATDDTELKISDVDDELTFKLKGQSVLSYTLAGGTFDFGVKATAPSTVGGGTPDSGNTLTTKDYVDALVSGSGVTDLNGLSDVDITSSASGHILIHDGTSYKNRTAVKADISDFTETDYVHTTGDETVAGIKTFSDDVIVNGDLTVNGTTTTVNSTNLEVTDNIINLNKDEAGAGVTAGSAGVRIERGTETDVQIIFDEADDTFKAGEVGSERVLATTFQESFVVADWTTGTPNTYVITAATHGLGYTAGQVFMVQVFESSGGTASLTTIDTEVNETTGDITLKTAGSTFDGAVIISK